MPVGPDRDEDATDLLVEAGDDVAPRLSETEFAISPATVERPDADAHALRDAFDAQPVDSVLRNLREHRLSELVRRQFRSNDVSDSRHASRSCTLRTTATARDGAGGLQCCGCGTLSKSGFQIPLRRTHDSWWLRFGERNPGFHNFPHRAGCEAA